MIWRKKVEVEREEVRLVELLLHCKSKCMFYCERFEFILVCDFRLYFI